MNFLDSESALHRLQHGFRAKHSCESQLIGFTQEIHDSIDGKKQTDMVVMDFSKGYDKDDHQRLILKLFRICIHPQVVYWIQSFLNERTQKGIVSREKSNECRVQSRVPHAARYILHNYDPIASVTKMLQEL